MAVIREQRQFKIGTIGVNRPSRAGVMVGEAIADAASTVENMFFDINKDMAKQRGMEAAEQLSREDIVALDENGRPKAYKPPSIIGKFEREAYNAVLMQRFESEIQNDLQTRSSELAIQFRRSPEAYKKAMGDYVASMANTEGSTVFTNYINTLGTGLTQQQYRGLQLQAIQRQEADDKVAYANDAAKSLRDIEDAAAAGLDVSQLISDSEGLDTINVRSGTVLPSSVKNNGRERRLAQARGVLRYELSKALEQSVPKAQLEQALVAVDLGDPSLIPDGIMDGFKTLLSKEGFTFNQEISQFGLELLQDGVNQTTLNNQALIRQRLADAAMAGQDITNEYFDLLKGSTEEVQGQLETLVNQYMTDRDLANSALSAGYSADYVGSLTAESNSRLNSTVDAVTNKMYSQVRTVEELKTVQRYLQTPTQKNFEAIQNDDVAQLAQGLVQVSQTLGTREFLEKADSYAEGIADDIGVLDRAAKSQASIDVSKNLKENILPRGFSASNENDLAEVIEEANRTIGAANLTDGDRERMRSYVANESASYHLKLAFASGATEQAINAMKIYARDGIDETGIVTTKQKELIDKARAASDDSSSYTTSLDQYSYNAQNKRKLKASMLDDQTFMSNVTQGIADGTSKTERERLGKLLKVDASYYLDPSFDDPKYAVVTAALQQAAPSIWPQGQVDAINMFLTGKVTDPQQIERVLTLFAKSSEFVTKSGDVMRSNGSYSLTADQYALMSEAAAFAERNNDPQAILQHITQMKTAMQNPELQKAKDDFFSRKAKSSGTAFVDDVPGSNSVESYITKNFPQTLGNTNLRNRLISIANAHYFANQTELSDGRFDDLETVIQAEIDASYVKDDMIIAEDGTNMTMYPLSLTTGGLEDEFSDYVRQQMKQNSTDKTINWDEVDFKLVPVGHNEMDKGMTYGVVIVDENGTRQMQDVAYPFADPREVDPVVVPAFFSTNEAGFYQVKQGMIRASEMTAGAVATRTRVTDEVRDDLSFAIEPNKYNSILDKMPSIAETYRNLNRGSPDTILRNIAIVRGQLQVVDDPLAKEMIIDLDAMQEIVQGGVEEIRRQQASKNRDNPDIDPMSAVVVPF
jgi:hypothetical protein